MAAGEKHRIGGKVVYVRKGVSGKRGAKSYQSFSDKAAYSHAYEGTGEAQVAFFSENSNFDELISGMSREDRNAFRKWTGGYFMDGQQYGGWDGMSSQAKEYTQRMDDILDRATLDKGVTLVRLSSPSLVLGKGARANLSAFQAMEGQIITSKGAMSFGAAAEGLTIGSKKHVEYKLSIPGGVTGAGMWAGDTRINGWGAQQREFVTNRDVSVRVGKTTYDAKRKMYTVELTYDGLHDHDYGTTGRLNL